MTMTFNQFLCALRARYLVVVLVFLGMVAIAGVVSVLMPSKYTASTSLVLDGRTADPILGSVLPSQLMPGYLATQIDIIASDRVAQRVVALTQLDQVPVLRDQWQEATGGNGDIRTWIGTILKQQLEVLPSRDSSVLKLSFSGNDPNFAAAVANAYARAYIETTLELKVEPARQFAQWFNERTKGLREDLELAQRKLSEYEQEHGIIAGDGRFDIENARLADLSSQLVQVQGQRADSRSRHSQVGSAESLPEVMSNPFIADLKTQVARLEAQRTQMQGRFGANHPEVARVDAEIGSLKQRILIETQRVATSLGTTTRISAAREAEVAEALEVQKARVLEMKAHRDQVAVLRRDVENAQRAYDLVTQRLAQTSLESQSQQTNVVVLTPAVAPGAPSSPRLTLNLIAGCVLGLLLGVASALMFEMIDRRVRGKDDLLQLKNVPMLGVVPAAPGKRGGRFFSRSATA